MYEGAVDSVLPGSLEMLRTYGGALFNKMEKGNRFHAAATVYLKGKDGKLSLREGWKYNLIEPDIMTKKQFKKAMKDPKKRAKAEEKLKNLTENELIQLARDVAHETQFEYGKTGTPRALRTVPGRIGLQFSSFTVNQIAFLVRQGKMDPIKLMKWIAAAEGGNILLQKYLDTDMTNYFGVGTSWGEIFNAVTSATKGDLRKAYLHTKLAFSGGSGILPTGPGPTVTAAFALIKAAKNNKLLKQLKIELTPVQVRRITKAWESIKNRGSEGYPYFSEDGRLMFYIDGWALFRNTFGPSSAKDYKKFKEKSLKYLYTKDYDTIIDEIVTAAMIDGDWDKHDQLIDEIGIYPTYENYLNKVYKREYTDEQREILSGRFKSKQRLYQMRKEGE